MTLLTLLSILPATGDTSPTRHIILIGVIAAAAVIALVLGLSKGKK